MFKFYVYFMVLLKFGLTAKFPSDLPNCNYGDGECIKDAINEILPRLKNGLPALNIIPYDPLELPRIDMNQDTGPVTVKASGLNIKIHGLSTFRVTKVIGFDENPLESKFEMHGELDRASMACDYKVNGRLFVLPVDGTGTFNITGIGSTIKVKFYPIIVERKNKVYLQIRKFSYRPRTKHVQMHLTYDNDEVFGRTLQTFLNENWRDIYVAVEDEFNRVGSNIVIGLLNSVLRKVKYSGFFKNG